MEGEVETLEYQKDYGEAYPLIHAFLHKSILTNPPLCSLKELQDGTYSLDDVLTLNQLAEYKEEINALMTAEE